MRNENNHPFQCLRRQTSMNTWKIHATARHEDERHTPCTNQSLNRLGESYCDRRGWFARVETKVRFVNQQQISSSVRTKQLTASYNARWHFLLAMGRGGSSAGYNPSGRFFAKMRVVFGAKRPAAHSQHTPAAIEWKTHDLHVCVCASASARTEYSTPGTFVSPTRRPSKILSARNTQDRTSQNQLESKCRDGVAAEKQKQATALTEKSLREISCQRRMWTLTRE